MLIYSVPITNNFILDVCNYIGRNNVTHFTVHSKIHIEVKFYLFILLFYLFILLVNLFILLFYLFILLVNLFILLVNLLLIYCLFNKI